MCMKQGDVLPHNNIDQHWLKQGDMLPHNSTCIRQLQQNEFIPVECGIKRGKMGFGEK